MRDRKHLPISSRMKRVKAHDYDCDTCKDTGRILRGVPWRGEAMGGEFVEDDCPDCGE
jgi:hypothetical protein